MVGRRLLRGFYQTDSVNQKRIAEQDYGPATFESSQGCREDYGYERERLEFGNELLRVPVARGYSRGLSSEFMRACAASRRTVTFRTDSSKLAFGRCLSESTNNEFAHIGEELCQSDEFSAGQKSSEAHPSAYLAQLTVNAQTVAWLVVVFSLAF